MVKITPGSWSKELTPEQYEAIDWYMEHPPRYFKWFIPFFKKILSKVIFSILIGTIILVIISAFSGFEMFDTIKYIFLE